MQAARVGAQLKIASSTFEVVHVNENTLRFSSLQGGQSRTVELTTLSRMIAENQLEIVYSPPSALDPDAFLYLRSEQRRGVERKAFYVRSIVKQCDRPCSQKVIAPLIEKLAREQNDPQPPGASTVAGWVKTWLENHRQDIALAPALRPTRYRPTKLHPKVLATIQETIQDKYLTRQRLSKQAVHAEVVFRIHEANATTPEALEVPSAETVRKIIEGVDRYTRDRARFGKAYVQRKHRAAGKACHVTEPLECVVADGQVMDIILVDDDGQEIGRPFITVFLDIYSRCVLSAFVTLAPFSGATLLKALTTAVVADGKKPRGKMQKLVVDNGADYRHHGFTRFTNRFLITVEPCPPREPNGKAHIERFFRTLTEGFVHTLPGTTFSNPTARGDYDSQKFARVHRDQLPMLVNAWIDTEYHTRVHSSLMRAPIDVWNEAVAA